MRERQLLEKRREKRKNIVRQNRKKRNILQPVEEPKKVNAEEPKKVNAEEPKKVNVEEPKKVDIPKPTAKDDKMKIYISLTSINQKQNLLLNTLISISTQTVLPDKCYIYLSEEPYLLDKGFKNKIVSAKLQEFISKNALFEIKWCKNIGPYRKLLPILKSKWNEDCLILTIDDDIIYNKNLIKDYINDYKKYKCCITYRGVTHNFKKGDYSDFRYTKKRRIILKSLHNFANSGVGTITHPSFFHKTKNLIFNQELINELCKTTDDIWYYFCRIANNIETVVILKAHYIKFQHIQSNLALFNRYNNVSDTNTKNFRKTAKKFIELNLIDKNANIHNC